MDSFLKTGRARYFPNTYVDSVRRLVRAEGGGGGGDRDPVLVTRLLREEGGEAESIALFKIHSSVGKGVHHLVSARTLVDGTYSAVRIPSRSPASSRYSVDSDVTVVPVNALSTLGVQGYARSDVGELSSSLDLPFAPSHPSSFIVIGAGKTGELV